MAERRAESATITRGSTNIFEDLGYPDATERQAKLRLAHALNHVLEQRKLSQADAAKVLGVTQPKVSALRNYTFEPYRDLRRAN
jgi:predicted XRE-type DNA-binding protein